MATKFFKGSRSFTMSRIRKTNSKPELIVRKFLYANGYRYRIHYSKLPGNPDIALISRKITIFVNGCFWHAHNGCKLNRMPKSNLQYWLPKIQRNVIRDKENFLKLNRAGWKVIIVWECELSKKQAETTLIKLLKKIQTQNP